MLLEGFRLCDFGQGNIDTGGFQIGMAQRLLNGLKVRAAGYMVGSQGVAKRMYTGASDTSICHILGHPVLNGAGADWSLEPRDKQGVSPTSGRTKR
jgi:hypothetical protein